jgi:hypothetical protein
MGHRDAEEAEQDRQQGRSRVGSSHPGSSASQEQSMRREAWASETSASTSQHQHQQQAQQLSHL